MPFPVNTAADTRAPTARIGAVRLQREDNYTAQPRCIQLLLKSLKEHVWWCTRVAWFVQAHRLHFVSLSLPTQRAHDFNLHWTQHIHIWNLHENKHWNTFRLRMFWGTGKQLKRKSVRVGGACGIRVICGVHVTYFLVLNVCSLLPVDALYGVSSCFRANEWKAS